MGFRIGWMELGKAATGGYVLAVEGKWEILDGQGNSMVAMVVEKAGRERADGDAF